MSRVKQFFLLTAAAFIALSGLSHQIGFADSARDKTLVMAVPGTPASIDGEQALTSEGEMMMANVHGGDLFSYKIIAIPDDITDTVDLRSTGDGGVDGLTAKSWQMSDDGKTVTVQLRDEMMSPYGNKLTADDYVWSWARRFEVKAVGKFMADVLGIDGPESIRKIGFSDMIKP